VPTRFYFPASSAASETTTPDAGWNYTSEVSRHNLSASKGSSAITAGTTIGPLSGTATHKGVDRMWFTPAVGAQTISGTVSMMLMTREVAGTDNIDRPWMGIYVVRGNSKVATLLALGVQTGAATTEWVANATHRTCTFANGATLTSTAVQAGDKILVEVGGGNNTAGTSPEFSCKYGENATDATLGDNATTTDRAGWIEFSMTIAANTTPVDAGSMTTTATSSTTMAALLGFLVGLMTTIAASVTSLLTLLGILTGSQTSSATSTTSTTATVEDGATPVDTGAMTSAGSSSTTTTTQVGILTGEMTSSGTSSVTMTAQVGIIAGATTSAAVSATTTEATAEDVPAAGGDCCASSGMGLGLRLRV
jgi:hypothetical protein